MNPESFLDALWQVYAREVPHARRFLDLAAGSFRNDHVAFRSLARPGGGIASMAPLFERLGWRAAGAYEFPDAHLRAIHLSHPNALPRIFLSELIPGRLPRDAAEILLRMPPDPPPPEGLEGLVAWFAPPPVPPTRRELETVDAVSQYGAWLLAFGRKVNHFTGRVDDIEAWVTRLRAAGVPMKAEIEGAPGSALRQSATAAVPLPVALRDGGTVERPYAYFEIAERRAGFDGFLGPQARQLFEMTRPTGEKDSR